MLREKQAAGAEFAITDMVFLARDYFTLVERAAAVGVDIPILPGIMPILNLGQVTRMAELSGHPVPPEVVEASLEAVREWVDVPRGDGHVWSEQWPAESLREWHVRHGLLAAKAPPRSRKAAAAAKAE